MIGIGVGIGFSRRAAGAAPAFDAAAQVVIAAMEPEPDAARKTAINDFVVALKNGGQWPQLDFLHVYAAHSEASALINWKNPGTHNATAVNAPTFTVDRGFAGDGSTSYLNSNFVPSTDGVNYSLNDASFGVYSRTDAASNAIDIGATDSGPTNRATLQIRGSSDTNGPRVNQSDLPTHTAVSDSRGLWAARRASATAAMSYRNGTEYSTAAANSTAIPGFAMFVGARNSAGSAAQPSTRQYALAFAGAAMSADEQLALYEATQDYLTAVGAEV